MEVKHSHLENDRKSVEVFFSEEEWRKKDRKRKKIKEKVKIIEKFYFYSIIELIAQLKKFSFEKVFFFFFN
jgi:hypothetical protein